MNIVVIAGRRYDDEAIWRCQNTDWFASQLPMAVVILPRNEAFIGVCQPFEALSLL
ncbi:MAG TPA: hypothetical protein VK102_04185 [Sphingobacterium sp.]|nr:hypothetical protein [Sphingobacterium sp.]